MAPKYSTPRVWKRPYTSIYNDNYKYGNSLYSDEISNIERKYNEALARTTFRSDRPDVNFQSFSDSQLTGESIITRQRALASAAAAAATLDSDRYRSTSSTRIRTEDSYSRRQLQKSESFDNYSRAMANISSDLEESKLRRSRSTTRRRRPDSYAGAFGLVATTPFEDALLNKDDGPHNKAFWTERCRELQTQVDNVLLQLSEVDDKVRHESNLVKSKLTQDVTDLLLTIDDQDRQIGDLQKMLKKQAKHVADITLELEASQRHYADISDTLNVTQKRCQNLVHEVDDIRSGLDKVSL